MRKTVLLSLLSLSAFFSLTSEHCSTKCKLPLTVSGGKYDGNKLLEACHLSITPGAKFELSGGSTLTVIAENIDIGNAVSFYAKGTNGTTGADGGDPGPDDLLSHDDFIRIRDDARRHGCGYNGGGVCGTEYCGKPGSNGGNGGPGGNIVLYLRNIKKVPASITLNTEGGDPGQGGKGKPARRIGCNQNPHSDERWACGGKGVDGGPGEKGTDGKIEVCLTGKNATEMATLLNNSAFPTPVKVQVVSEEEWRKMVEEIKRKTQQ